MKRYWPLVSLVLFVVVFVYFLSFRTTSNNSQTSTSTATSSSVQIEQRSKSSGCQIQGPLPDQSCTPGAIFTIATVDQICKSGYSKSVRDVPTSEKNQVYAEYGIESHATGEYEVDHLISLELGGSNDIANLWPEPAEPVPGFHQKDLVENYLHQQVCAEVISLDQAQQDIASNWLKYYPIPSH